MPTQIKEKVIDPEAELSSALRKYKKLAPLCTVEQRAKGIPQLAPQEKQLGILNHELKETLLCINLAKKGQHAVRDANVKKGTGNCIVEYENLEAKLRNQRSQLSELDCLNYLASKKLVDLFKKVPTEGEELAMIENANNKLRQMENRLEIATKRFCIVNSDNKKVREEIDRLLVERNDFNIQWNHTIGKLVKGKEFLMDIFEIAAVAFGNRDECCRRLDALKWKGLFQLNRDISEMQSYECDLNHLAKLEEFLRVKGSRRICEADEIYEMKRQEEIQRCEAEIARHDALLEEIFAYTGLQRISAIMNRFDNLEIENFSAFVLLCECLQETIMLRRHIEIMRQRVIDQREINEARLTNEMSRLKTLTLELDACRARNQELAEANAKADESISKVLKGVNDLVNLSRCNIAPLLSLLGNHKEPTVWNVVKFLRIFEAEVKSLIEIVYGAVNTSDAGLEQEKHLLRRRLDTTQGEYEARLLELQNDIRALTNKIDTRDTSVKQREEEKTSLIAELTAQNSRLTTQLKESSAIEAHLVAQLDGLKDQCSMRKTSLQDHVHSLDSLKAELALVCDKKADLERRLTTTLGDKDNLIQQLDEANDRIVALERQLKEQEVMYQNTLKDLERLQRSHDTLAERVGTPETTDITDSGRSLHAEMETGPDDEDESWLRGEAVIVYKQLRALALQLNTGHDDDSGLHSDLSLTSLDGDENETLRRGALSAACADAAAAFAALEGSRVRDSIAAHARRALERERQIDEKNEIIADLSSKLSVAEIELQAAADQRDRLLADANCSSLESDEAVTRARQERDEAIERKKIAEVALAKTRVELMQANSQLYEAVRQKVDLGQQLEQWQMDMQELINEQMKSKLTSQEKRRKLPEPPVPTRTARILGFFQR